MDGIASLGHGDDAGDRNGVEGEVSRRRCGHQHWPAKSDARGDSAMKDQFCGADGKSEVRQVEEPLNRAWTWIGVPQRLDKPSETPHQQCFRIREVKNANED